MRYSWLRTCVYTVCISSNKMICLSLTEDLMPCILDLNYECVT